VRSGCGAAQKGDEGNDVMSRLGVPALAVALICVSLAALAVPLALAGALSVPRAIVTAVAMLLVAAVNWRRHLRRAHDD
jgi:membrane protein implicated in regulation of membrane protease activity